MSKHTPAPWRHYKPAFAKTEHVVQRGQSGGFVVLGDNAESDARLIASAPELLEALKSLVDLHVIAYGLDGAWDEQLNKAQKAISKAECKQ